jgi:MFS family permease
MRWREISLRPRIGVPSEIRAAFVAPAAAAFASFALLGFYAALTPSLLTRVFHQPDHAVDGAVVFELYLFAVLTIVLSRRLGSRAAMLAGLALLLPSLALLLLSRETHTLPMLLGDSALAGIAVALGYRGSLQVINEIAPAGRRAEVVSSYLLAAYTGVALPVVGIGVISHFATAEIADLVFAGVVALLAIAALVMGARYRM